MKIKIQGFYYQVHSWSIVNQNIGRALIKLGHQVDFIPTDEHLKRYSPPDLESFIKPIPDKTYDCQISYTAPRNWKSYLSYGDKNRFAIWAFEYNGKGILPGFAKNHLHVDKVLPPSEFTKEVFINMGIPADKMVVVPHGINLEDYKSEKAIQLKTNKKHKILLNIAQPHKRKAIHLALETFGKAFTNKDDVCLVAKVLLSNSKEMQFDVNFNDIYKDFQKKFPRHAEVELVTSFIPDIVELYNSCDINFSATYAECWHLPSLEAITRGLINVVPRYGGQLDFCNDDNSILLEGTIKKADRTHQYWGYSPYAVHFVIDTDKAAEKLQYAVRGYDSLKEKMLPSMRLVAEKYTWENVAKQILGLCK